MKRWLTAAYKTGYSFVPKRLASAIDYRLASKTVVYHDSRVHPVQALERGVVTVSLDFEMAWGWLYSRNDEEDIVAKGLRERQQVPLILEKFEEYDFPATWATVGHLLLEKCSRGPKGGAHEGMPRLLPFEAEHWRFTSGDWFQFDPCSDVRRDPAWYAPDLVERILASRVKHELGCHSFSHAGFGPYCPADVAAAELDACRDAMARYGLTPITWVFPRHDEGNFQTLAANGIRIVRAFPKLLVNVSLPVKRSDGMWGVHVSSAIDRGRDWTLGQRLERLLKFVDTASATKLGVHIWLHPSLPSVEMWGVLFPLLRYCADKREKGGIDILTMEQLVTATEMELGRDQQR